MFLERAMHNKCRVGWKKISIIEHAHLLVSTMHGITIILSGLFMVPMRIC